MERLPGYDAWKTRAPEYPDMPEGEDAVDVETTRWTFDLFLAADVAATTGEGRVFEHGVGDWTSVGAGVWIIDDGRIRVADPEEQSELDERHGAADHG